MRTLGSGYLGALFDRLLFIADETIKRADRNVVACGSRFPLDQIFGLWKLGELGDFGGQDAGIAIGFGCAVEGVTTITSFIMQPHSKDR